MTGYRDATVLAFAVHVGFEIERETYEGIHVLVNYASAASWTGVVGSSVEEVERAWEVNGQEAFVCSQEPVGDMFDGNGGTVIFTAATSAVRSRRAVIGFTTAKFAAWGMAMDITQENGDEGVHVAPVVIGGQIDDSDARDRYPDHDDDTFLNPDEIAETYWHLVTHNDMST